MKGKIKIKSTAFPNGTYLIGVTNGFFGLKNINKTNNFKYNFL